MKLNLALVSFALTMAGLLWAWSAQEAKQQAAIEELRHTTEELHRINVSQGDWIMRLYLAEMER